MGNSALILLIKQLHSLRKPAILLILFLVFFRILYFWRQYGILYIV